MISKHELRLSANAETERFAARRAFLGGAIALGAGAAMGMSGARQRRNGRRNEHAAQDEGLNTKFARVVPINTWADGGVWAIVSDFGMPVTLSNGGVIAGKDKVVIVDGFNSPGGAAWVSKIAKQLTGRSATHVVITHYHFDHTDGLSGFYAGGPAPMVISTRKTRELLAKRGVTGGDNPLFKAPASPIPGLAMSHAPVVLPEAVIDDASTPLTIDLGGKALTLRERSGHTPSDLTMEVDGGGPGGERVVFAGDLVFHKVFPVYLDAQSKALKKNLVELSEENGGKNIVVPGHGPIASGADLQGLIGVVDFIADYAAKARTGGMSSADAAAKFALPEALKDYTPGNPLFVKVAMDTMYEELRRGL